ncbi:MAG: phage tail protein [Planctomycetota bacterium]|nr:phage tail protein [Planctomycetota bacterium]
MPNRRSHDPIGNYNFRVEIEGVTQGAFKAVEGLDSQTEIIEYQDGDDITLRKRPGKTRYSNIVLKRGFVNSQEFWDWRKAVVDGKVDRKSGSVILLDDSGGEVMRYNFFEGWPCSWKGFELNGRGSEASVEEIQIAVERIERG